MPYAHVGIIITKYGYVYLVFASHNIENKKPPTTLIDHIQLMKLPLLFTIPNAPIIINKYTSD